MWLRAPGVVRGAAGPWSRASFYSNIIVCKRVRVQACASVCTDAPPPGRRRGAGPRRPAPAPLRAASRVNKREPAARRGPGGRGAARRGRRKLGGAPAHPPGSGKGRGRAGSERGWAPGLAAGRPASFRGAGPPLGRDVASPFPSASARPGPGALSLRSPRRAGGSGAAPGGHLPWLRPSARRLRPRQARPGPASCAGPDPPRLRSGRGGGGEPPGTRRCPAGALGRPRPLGDVSARPAPSDPALGTERLWPAGRHGWCRAAAATSFAPGRPGSSPSAARPRPLAAPRPGVGSGAFPSAKGFRAQLALLPGGAGTPLWPLVPAHLPPSPPCPFRRRLAARAGRKDCLPGTSSGPGSGGGGAALARQLGV